MLMHGKFSTRKMYQNLKDQSHYVMWKKVLFGNAARARFIHTLWMTCHGILPTKERLDRFGMLPSADCNFCRESETLDQMFYDCSGIKRIWKSILKWLDIVHSPGAWKNEITWMINMCKKNSNKIKIL